MVIPNTVVTIGNSAFANTWLTEVVIPSSVTTLRNSVFSNCTYLTGIVVPDSVTSMGTNIFTNCSQLKAKCYAGSYAETYFINNKIKYSYIVFGDVDGDGALTYNDAKLILHYAADKNFKLPAAADMDSDGDGEITVMDPIHIMRYLEDQRYIMPVFKK